MKSFIIDNIHYINFVTFNISTLFHKKIFLICSGEIGMHPIYPCVLIAIKYGKYCFNIDLFI